MANFEGAFTIDELTAVSAIVVVITTIVIALSYLTWKGSRHSFSKVFIALMLSEESIALGYFHGLIASTLDHKLIFNLIEYFGYLTAPVLFLVFVLLYTNNRYATRRNLALLSIGPLSFIIAIATNPVHHLYYTYVDLPYGPFSTFYAENGPLFYAFGLYTLAIIVSVVIILARHYMRMPRAYRTSVILVMSYAIISMITVCTYYITGEILPSGLVITTGLIIGSIPLFVGASRFELFQVLPFANQMLMDNMQDGAVVLDENDHIMFMNRSAENMAGMDWDRVHRDHVSKAFPSFPTNAFNIMEDGDDRTLTVGSRFYDISTTAIKSKDGTLMGKIALIKDVTSTKEAEEEARRANETLDILNGFTRHDIKNQLMVLEGHLSLIKLKSKDPTLERHVEAAITSGHNINKQLQLAHEYQELGRRASTWQSLHTVCANVERMMDLPDVELTVESGDVMILADPLYSNVMVNLVTNSMMHGEQVTRIFISTEQMDDHLEIVYRDDGIGIVDDYKKIIFEKGVGKNTGMGLYLVRMILDIGGMKIIEDGVPGEGARFRISVPRGRYRFPDCSQGTTIDSIGSDGLTDDTGVENR